MQLRKSRIAAILAAVAVAGAVPLLGSGADQAIAAASTAPAWAIQPGGTLGYLVVNNGSETITGSFSKWGGTINFDPDSPGDAAIKIDIDLASTSVGDGFKDDLLQGDEFFSASSWPTATFASQSVEPQPDGRFVAHGTLNLHGMSMPQDVEFRLSGSGAERHVEGTASIDRLGFGIGTGSHGGGLDNAVAVTFAFDAKRG